MAEKYKPVLYISQRHLGLKIVIEPNRTVEHEKTKQPYKTGGKSFKFNDGKYITKSLEEEKLLDSILAGTCDGRNCPPPEGIIKMSKKTIDLVEKVQKDQEINKEKAALEEVERRSGRGKGSQGSAALS